MDTLQLTRGQGIKVVRDGKAVFASRVNSSRGRLYSEPPSKTRGDFERDRDRIIHCSAFRRLNYKTQVFVCHEGDHYRTRLSHSMEVAQVARSLARLLKVDEDLAETCALAHDLGHTPFAHTGEEALRECMQPYGGFSHNDQTLRIVTKLEKKYPQFDGLNLTWESLEGLIKHSGPVVKKGEKRPQLHMTLREMKSALDLDLSSHASLEAQIAAIADDVAYNSHDLDDGLAAGFFTSHDLTAVPWVDAIVLSKKKGFPHITDSILAHEITREVMGVYVMDVLAETTRRLDMLKPQDPDDIRRSKIATVALSAEMEKKDKQLRDFLWENFYRHHTVNRARFKAFRIVQDLFGAFMEHRGCLPPNWLARAGNTPKGWKQEDWHARIVTDYIAGMTDRMAVQEHGELFGISRA